MEGTPRQRQRVQGMLSPHMPPMDLLSIDPGSSDTHSMLSYTSSRTAFSDPESESLSRRPSQQRIAGNVSTLFKNIDLRINAVGSAGFDHLNEDGELVAPRQVDEMHWCSEQYGDAHEYIILKISDVTRERALWVRFKPYSGETFGDVAFSLDRIMPMESSLRASLTFVNGVNYHEVQAIRLKVSRRSQGLHTKPGRPIIAAAFVEMTSLLVDQGLGECTPLDLCEIWPALPDLDRRLQAFFWYEQSDDTGTEYLVLQVTGSSNFSESEDWWVRIERDGATDKALISKNRELLVQGSNQRTETLFKDGIPFEKVIEALKSVPTGFDLATEDCWYYASTVAHKLSMEVGDDYFRCPTENLWEIWSGERGAHLLVNRVQWFQHAGSHYLVLNVSATKHDKHGIWISLARESTNDGDIDIACITRNRKRLIRPGSSLSADIAFDELEFGKVVQVQKQVNRQFVESSSANNNSVSKSAMTVRELTQLPHLDCYWLKGDASQLFGLSNRS